MSKSKQRAVAITDRETIRWLERERKRRGDGTLGRTATKIIAEFRAMREREECAAGNR